MVSEVRYSREQTLQVVVTVGCSKLRWCRGYVVDAAGGPPRPLLSVEASIPWLLHVLPVNSCLPLLLLQQICLAGSTMLVRFLSSSPNGGITQPMTKYSHRVIKSWFPFFKVGSNSVVPFLLESSLWDQTKARFQLRLHPCLVVLPLP